jgi:Nucleotidyltransferase of unknown function (DUF6036)
MRSVADAGKIRHLMREIGRRARGPGRVYLVGGASALLEGWRATTVDVDLKLDPEPAGIFEAIGALKNDLDVNVELSAPDQFLPPLPDWRERSVFIERQGEVEFFHYDFRAQALAKLARGYDRDLADVRAMLARNLVSRADLVAALETMRPDLLRYPALDADAFARRVKGFVDDADA